MIFLVILGTIALVVGLFALSGLLIMFAWNAVLVALLHWPVITWVQGIGISLLLAMVSQFFSSLRAKK